jgi:hypothetical protein
MAILNPWVGIFSPCIAIIVLTDVKPYKTNIVGIRVQIPNQYQRIILQTERFQQSYTICPSTPSVSALLTIIQILLFLHALSGAKIWRKVN